MFTKLCSKCREKKPLTAFSKHAGTPDGLQGHCKSCMAGWYAVNRDRVRAQQRARHAEKRQSINE